MINLRQVSFAVPTESSNPKVRLKISKIASPSMKICTNVSTLASSRKNSVFISYDWSLVVKNEGLFNKFY